MQELSMNADFLARINSELLKFDNSDKYDIACTTYSNTVLISFKFGDVVLALDYYYIDNNADLDSKVLDFMKSFKYVHNKFNVYAKSIENSIKSLGIVKSYQYNSITRSNIFRVTSDDIQIDESSVYSTGIESLDSTLRMFADNKIELQKLFSYYTNLDESTIKVVAYNSNKYAIQSTKNKITIYDLATLGIVRDNSGLFNSILAKYNFFV